MGAFDNLKVMAKNAETLEELREVVLIMMGYLEHVDELIMELIQDKKQAPAGFPGMPPGFPPLFSPFTGEEENE